MSGRKYARGRNAIAECQRSGQKMRYRDLVEDGHVPGLLVHPDWWEPKHPQEIPVEIHDPIALYRPAPEISIEDDYGNPDVNYGATPTAPVIIDTFNRADGDPGVTWQNSGLNDLFPTYFGRPQISGNALDPTPVGPYSFYAVSHTDTVPVDHYCEITLTDVNPGAYFVGIYVWVRANVGLNAAMTTSVDDGYYCYLSASTLYGTTSLSLSRWDQDLTQPVSGGAFLNGTPQTIPGAGVVPDGTVLGVRCVGYDILGYLRFPDGTVYDTGGSVITNATSNSEPGQIGQPFTGQNRYVNQQRTGIGLEGYGGGTVSVDRFESGGVNTHSGTLATTFNGGETRVVASEGFKIGPWAEWIGIELDGGGWHMSRLADGQGLDDSVVFAVDFNTAFPAASTATAGNSYYIGGRR